MTEAEWLACTDPDEMLKHLGRRVSNRKLRLFACACYRHVPRLFEDERIRTAVEGSERYADGLADKQELAHTLNRAFSAVWTIGVRMAYPTPRCAEAARQFTARAARDGAAERRYQAVLLCDIFGNPFCRPPSIDPSLLTWSDGLVPKLARAAYEDRHLPTGTFDEARIAVLADALDEAACTDDALVSHLRAEGPHVRGCWAVDLLLGKS
jgi:hypothetical protein